MIRFFCHKCGCRLKVRAELAEQNTRCPICSAVNVVPAQGSNPLPRQGHAPQPASSPLKKKLVDTGLPINASRHTDDRFEQTRPKRVHHQEDLLNRLSDLKRNGVLTRFEYKSMKERVYHLPKNRHEQQKLTHK